MYSRPILLLAVYHVCVSTTVVSEIQIFEFAGDTVTSLVYNTATILVVNHTHLNVTLLILVTEMENIIKLFFL